jgi:UDP-N-acetyl-D-glucosamine dehydrogenase
LEYFTIGAIVWLPSAYVWEVINAAATKPFDFMKLTPGRGSGGTLYSNRSTLSLVEDEVAQLYGAIIELASETKTSMPRFAVRKVQDALNNAGKPDKGSRILILGDAYKPDSNDVRESPALDVIGPQKNKGAEVTYHDPHIPHLKQDGWELESTPDVLAAASASDCAVIVTNHSTYDYPALLQMANLVVDTRNALGNMGKESSKVVRS